MNARYEGRPLLRLLELYCIDLTGELQHEDRARLEAMTPMLQRTYARSGNWREILASVMAFPTTTDAEIQALWIKSQERARLHGVSLSAEQFAQMIVDKNFLPSKN